MPTIELNSETRPEILRIARETERGQNGYNALNIAELLGMSSSEMADYLKIDVSGMRKNPESAKTQARLTKLVALADIVIISESAEYLRAWLRSPNPAMGYRTPADRLLKEENAAEQMLEQIISVLSGQGQ